MLEQNLTLVGCYVHVHAVCSTQSLIHTLGFSLRYPSFCSYSSLGRKVFVTTVAVTMNNGYLQWRWQLWQWQSQCWWRWQKKAKLNICYGTPSRQCHLRSARVHGRMARNRQRRTYLPLTFPSRSRYSFTDPERMEGWVSPGPGCKQQLAHGCYATARS